MKRLKHASPAIIKYMIIRFRKTLYLNSITCKYVTFFYKISKSVSFRCSYRHTFNILVSKFLCQVGTNDSTNVIYL